MNYNRSIFTDPVWDKFDLINPDESKFLAVLFSNAYYLEKEDNLFCFNTNANMALLYVTPSRKITNIYLSFGDPVYE